MRDAIYVLWVIFGSGALLFSAFTMWKIWKDPAFFIVQNRGGGGRELPAVLRYAVLIGPFVMLWFAGYHFAENCIGWIPEDWVDREGESVRKGFSGTLSAMGAFWLSSLIGSGLGARVELAEEALRERFKQIEGRFKGLDPEYRIKQMERLQKDTTFYMPGRGDGDKERDYQWELYRVKDVKDAGPTLISMVAGQMVWELGQELRARDR